MTVMRSLRFLIGAALVAGGLQLVGPLALKMAAVGRAAAADAARSGPSGVVPSGMPAVGGRPAAPVTQQGALPPVAIGLEAAGAPWDQALETTPPDSGGGLQWDHAPPPPPAPLPPVPHELAQATPAFGSAYRSTLRVPPPDLLDATAPPPTASWAPPDPAVPERVPAPVLGIATASQIGGGDLTVPATYRVQDGDDLGTIAGRFYGYPGAAAAIWSANRAAIPDPELLPIGAELRLPPSWAVTPHRQVAHGAIEPAAYARPVVPTAGHGAASVPGGTAWLAPAPPPQPAAAAAGPQFAPVSTASHSIAAATSVRVGPGETLPSLARRLYGDPAVAGEIFAVNRDRLRSPELVVAGMELRLPRPVRAPGP